MPLDVDECVNLVKTGDSEDNGDESLCSNKKIADILIHDTQVVVESMRGKYLFDPSCSNWYKWLESYWSEIPSNKLIMEVEGFMLRNANKFQTKFTTLNTVKIASGYLLRCASYLVLTDDYLNFKPGKNFLNGFFQYSERKLCPHSSDKFVIDPPTIHYNKDEYINYNSRRFIVNAMGRNVHNIHLFRSMGNRSLCERPGLQTGYIFSGPPGSGKSTVTSLFSGFSPHRFVSCELREIHNSFTRHEYRNMNVIAINEVHQITPETESLLKSMQGRDMQSTSQKNKQGVSYWRFNGFLILMTNMSTTTVLGDSNSLNDRFLSIEFSPRLGNPDPDLLHQLEKNGSGIINWVLSMPEERFSHLTRATNINKYAQLESNQLIHFIIENCVFEKNRHVSLAHLFDRFQEWLIEKGEDYTVSKNDFFVELQTIAKSVFNHIVDKKRARIEAGRLILFSGLRLRESGEVCIVLEDDSFVFDAPIWENVDFPTLELSDPIENYIDIEIDTPIGSSRDIKEEGAKGEGTLPDLLIERHMVDLEKHSSNDFLLLGKEKEEDKTVEPDSLHFLNQTNINLNENLVWNDATQFDFDREEIPFFCILTIIFGFLLNFL